MSVPQRNPRKLRPLADRFWPKVAVVGPDECWEWTARRSREGYGQISAGKLQDGGLWAHRVAYELVIGPIPDGLQIDHLCRNRGCVNPVHMEAVLPRTNYLRGIGPTAQNAAKTHCLRGHPFDEANTYRRPGATNRACKACQAERDRQYKARRAS